MDYREILAAFAAAATVERAAPMKRYMRDQFEFFGLMTPLRRSLSRPLLQAARRAETVDWEFVEACWAKAERECQYLAVDYLRAVQDRLLTPADLPRVRSLALRKSWWDTIDGLDRVVGAIALRHPEAKGTVLEWSLDSDFWLRRLAIDHQLTLGERTDTALLTQVIENNLGQREFFINKAIGWALRDYSKTDPAFVQGFIETHRELMAPLSIREASKRL
ncbi:MAG: DNA alkylation repair protein [Propionibacteriaceae bacterium]|jgi:3-methyladenine DNA glycosylase AlkD|nr:DNA alkylation repair protein [Propionibacteriaceae bacterium]